MRRKAEYSGPERNLKVLKTREPRGRAAHLSAGVSRPAGPREAAFDGPDGGAAVGVVAPEGAVRLPHQRVHRADARC